MTYDDLEIPGWTERDLEVADALILSPLGRQAAEAGWIMALWDFCRREHRLPFATEMDHLKARGRILDQAIDACGTGNSAWARLGTALKQRREAMAQRVLSWGQA